MLALCLMLLGTYYAQNYAGIIGRSLKGVQYSLTFKCTLWNAIVDKIQKFVLYIKYKLYASYVASMFNFSIHSVGCLAS